jgi:purine-binding chemotaxis protein CheW
MPHRGDLMEILLFNLAEQTFGIPVEYVESIEHMLPITHVPKAKQYVEGLVNIRGNIMPAIDISKLLNLKVALTRDTLILINNNNQSMALIVDEVDDVIKVNDECIKIILSENEKHSVFDYQNILVTYICKEELNKI